MKTLVHHNSLEAYYQGNLALFQRREREVLKALAETGSAMTDRQIQEFLDYQEAGAVRPRITGLVKRGVLQQVGSTTCEHTGKTVRLVRIMPRTDAAQLRLAI